MIFKKEHTESDFAIGDAVWLNTFVNPYKCTIVDMASDGVMSKSKRFVLQIDSSKGFIIASEDMLSKRTHKE